MLRARNSGVGRHNHGLAANRGFSLIELVAVMVLVAILATFASQRFTGTSGYDEYIVRDQLITAIRFAQQRAMYDHATGSCYRVTISANNYIVQRSTDSGSTFAAMDDFDFSAGDSAVADALGKVTLTALTLYFDGLGNPVGSCAGTNAGNQAISIAGDSTLPLCIYSTGYVRATAC